MESVSTKIVSSLTNGRGPLRGSMELVCSSKGVREKAEVWCGACLAQDVPASNSHVVIVSCHGENWLMMLPLSDHGAMRCEIIGNLMESMQHTYTRQLENMGFVRFGWQKLEPPGKENRA